ncbi:MAG: endonuclease/exonuclease/phosphatase family protein [Deltaproteobacteria bacterium]|nr:endonuclease/exonuclease/phosphatase family protein [Deltaproteobacteria bacterium]
MVRKFFVQPVQPLKDQYGKAHLVLQPQQIFSFLVWNTNKINAEVVIDTMGSIKQVPAFSFLQEVSVSLDDQYPFSYFDHYQWTMAKNLYLPQKKKFSGVKTGSIYVSNTSQVWHSKNKEPLIYIPKPAVASYHPVGNQQFELLTVNVHMLNMINTQRFLHELESLYAIIDQHQGSVVLAGDFNTWSKRKMSALLDFSHNLGLSEVAFGPDNIHRLSKRQLSFVFTRGILVHQTQVLTSVTASDHYPLLVYASII